MKTVTCDICGEPISKKEEWTAHLADRETSCGGVLERIAWDMDVHQECMEIGRKMDVRGVVLRAWKAAVRARKGALGT